MSLLKFEPKFFKVKQLKDRIGIKSILEDAEGVVVTYNQLMKSEAAFKFIFIFDEAAIEVPSLISYCNYFDVELFKLLEEEAAEVKSVVKYAQMVCIPACLTLDLPRSFMQTLSEAGQNCAEIAQDISKMDLSSA